MIPAYYQRELTRLSDIQKVREKKEIILKFFLKTDSSIRSFAMNDMLYNYLKALKDKQNDMLRETLDYKDFLCVNEVGELLTPDSITKKFRKLLNEKELPYIKFHALRHSCISLLANNNQFSTKQIQDYAGHADFLTTIPVPNSNTKPSAVHTDKKLSNRHCLLNKSAMPIFLNHLQLC